MSRRDCLCLTALFCLILIATHAAANPKKPEEPTPTGGWILKTDQPVKVDGVLDDACWKAARPVQVNFTMRGRGVVSDEPVMTAWYAWDDYYLYIAYETFDRDLRAEPSGEKEGPPDNQRPGCRIWNDEGTLDVVEFFISFGDERFMWEIHQNALNQFNDVFCIVPADDWEWSKSSMQRFGIFFGYELYIRDDVDEEHKLAIAVKLKPRADGKPSTVNDPEDEDTGYTAEIRLPWHGIGAPAKRRKWVPGKPLEPGGKPRRLPDKWLMAGQTIMLLAVCQNATMQERYHHSSPTRHGGWFHKSTPHWPRYALVQRTSQVETKKKR